MDYSAELLRNLSEKSRALVTLKNLNSKQPSLTQLHFTTMSNWLHDLGSSLCPESPKVPQMALSYLYLFLSKVSLKTNESLELLCWVSLSLACKVEGKTLLIKDIQRALDGGFSASSIVTTEMYVTEHLGWDFAVSTAHEIIEILVFSGITRKLDEVRDLATAYSADFYSNPNCLAIGSFPIAIASIMKAMTILKLGEQKVKFIKDLAIEFHEETELAKNLLTIVNQE